MVFSFDAVMLYPCIWTFQPVIPVGKFDMVWVSMEECISIGEEYFIMR